MFILIHQLDGKLLMNNIDREQKSKLRKSLRDTEPESHCQVKSSGRVWVKKVMELKFSLLLWIINK